MKISTGRPRPALTTRGDDHDRLRVRDMVGGAHVILGALGFVGLMVSAIFGDLFISTQWLIGMGIGGLINGATVLSGLWIRDGKSRGAAVGALLAAVRIALSVYRQNFGLDLMIAAVLLAGVVYVWPSLSADGED